MKKIGVFLLIAIVALLAYKCNTKEKIIIDNNLHSNMGKINESSKGPDSAQIYIDASGSMKGYFISSKSAFNDVMGRLWGYSDIQKVFFIGQTTPYHGLIANLLFNLRAQPNNAASPLDHLIPDLCKKSGNGICFLVTDGIQSVGGNNQLALEQYKQRLRIELASQAANKAVAVLKFSSEFKSDPGRNVYYYDMYDARKNITVSKRPYYVIAVGNKEVIRDLKKRSSKQLQPEKQVFFGIHDYKGHNDNRQQEDSTYRLQNTNNVIKLSATLPNCLRDVYYIKNNTQVFQNDVLKTAGVKCDANGNLLVTIDPTATPSMSPTPNGNVSYNVKIKNVIPVCWYELSSVDDHNILTDSLEKTKTFSLKYLLEGIKEAMDTVEYVIELKYKFKY